MEKVSKKLHDSIKERCCEGKTGRVLIPTDIVNRYRTEMADYKTHPSLIRSKIIEIYNDEYYFEEE